MLARLRPRWLVDGGRGVAADVPRRISVFLPHDLVRIRRAPFSLACSSVKRVTCAHAALLYGRTLWFSKSFLRYRRRRRGDGDDGRQWFSFRSRRRAAKQGRARGAREGLISMARRSINCVTHRAPRLRHFLAMSHQHPLPLSLSVSLSEYICMTI